MSPQIKQQINARKKGTTQQYVSLGELRKFPIYQPSFAAEKKLIIDILVSLDDRINLLRETNSTLEAIAQALFNSWFVDFDPVRAKQSGSKAVGMDEATAALFPDSLEESELGMLPAGWRYGTVGDFARQQKGSVNPLNFPDVTFEHYSIPAFDAGELPVIESGARIKSNKTPVPACSVLISKLNPRIPRVWLPSKIGENAVCSTEFLVYLPTGGASEEYVYTYFKSEAFSRILCQHVTGTSNSHQRIKPDVVVGVPAVIAPPAVMQAFSAVVGPMLAKVKHGRQQAYDLATLRDTLLPRLISGQIPVGETTAIFKQAA